MAYDMNRCPQTEDEFKEYVYALIGKTLGAPAPDWSAVMSASYPWQGQSLRIPEGVGPGVRQQPDAPFFGLTQQWSNGPKGRVFLPSDQADENGFYTRAMQYLDDAPYAATRTVPHLNTATLSAKSAGLVWAWYYVAGHAYAPVLPADGTAPAPPVSGGLTEAQVQAMIDASLASFEGIKLGDKIALRTNSGLLAGIKGGGPTAADAPINWIGKTGDPHAWESLTIEKGE